MAITARRKERRSAKRRNPLVARSGGYTTSDRFGRQQPAAATAINNKEHC